MMRAAATWGAAAQASHVVATSCPRCGAPLDFAEASNAVRCAHCGVVLLVTGRRQVLSYTVAPRIGRREARELVGGVRPVRAPATSHAEPRLLLVPYYRLTAEELSWQRQRIVTRRRSPLERLDHLGESLLDLASSAGVASEKRETIELVGRRIERSFLACEAGGVASWSLGVRTGVLRLELFRRDALDPTTTVLPPTLARDAALARALTPLRDVDLVHRDVLRATLSLIYFPLWVVETSARGMRGVTARVAVLDAVSGAIVARDLDPAALASAASASAPPDRVLGFRPLTCPNCGWDLPLRPEDVVFHCASCERTWELLGEELEQIASTVVTPPTATTRGEGRGARAVAAHAGAHRLPVWEVSAATRVVGRSVSRQGAFVDRGSRAELPQRLYAPAFRWRALKALCDLGARLSRRAPEIEDELSKAPPLVGCSLDRSDAVTLARLIALRLVTPHEVPSMRRDDLPTVELGAPRLRLLWLPFAGDAYSVREPFTGSALARRSVEELVARN
ncbi:MAG TPA: zinc ribbon domain-containing protein [Candidatus Binatia bacterium]